MEQRHLYALLTDKDRKLAEISERSTGKTVEEMRAETDSLIESIEQKKEAELRTIEEMERIFRKEIIHSFRDYFADTEAEVEAVDRQRLGPYKYRAREIGWMLMGHYGERYTELRPRPKYASRFVSLGETFTPVTHKAGELIAKVTAFDGKISAGYDAITKNYHSAEAFNVVFAFVENNTTLYIAGLEEHILARESFTGHYMDQSKTLDPLTGFSNDESSLDASRQNLDQMVQNAQATLELLRSGKVIGAKIEEYSVINYLATVY